MHVVRHYLQRRGGLAVRGGDPGHGHRAVATRRQPRIPQLQRHRGGGRHPAHCQNNTG